jgi:hypothetical protein
VISGRYELYKLLPTVAPTWATTKIATPAMRSPRPTSVSSAVATPQTSVTVASSDRRCPPVSATAPINGESRPEMTSDRAIASDHSASAWPESVATYAVK